MPPEGVFISPGRLSFSTPVRFIATVVSFLFHPLLVGIMMAAFLIYMHPAYFTGIDTKTKLLRLLTVVNNNFVLPLLAVLLLKGLGFVKSLYLKTQKERIAPYIICMIFFFWTYYVFRNLRDIPQVMTDMCQGIFFASCVALLLNNYFKISMHAIGVGGLVGLMVVVLFSAGLPGAPPLVLSFLVCGLVCSSRMIVSDHAPFDILAGFVTGLACQLLAAWVF